MMREVGSTCCYCGVGCGVIIESDGARVTGVRGDPQHPANFGMLCTKGSALHLTMQAAARLTHPELRERRDEKRRRVSWDAALGFAANRFAKCIERHGPDSVAFYISGQLLTEDYYVFNKLAKALVGTNNVDTNSRLCMSSAVAAYKLSLGVDAPPCCYEDVNHADLILIAGSNTAFAHPVLFRRIEDARARNPKFRMIVVDPRATPTARAADLHLAVRPGTDVTLFNAMLHVMREDGLLNRRYIEAHTQGYEQLEALIARSPPNLAEKICDVPAELIVRAARWFAGAGAALSLYCQGLNQSVNGTFKNCALINLHLATGHIGRPGAGPLSLTGQPNAMGGREVGGMANLLPAHRDLANAADRAEVARFWGVPEISAVPGKTAVELFQALERQEVRMVWIACTNPAQSMPDAHAVRRALARAEFVVVQDTFRDTDTCEHADLLLPATGWAEKEGTVTNSERRISRVRAAVPAPGEARHDWQIATEFARRLGARLGRSASETLFAYREVESIFAEHRATTAGRDLDITGLSYALLDQHGPQQWPFPVGAREGLARLYADGHYPTTSGRARFVVTEPVAPAESPDADYPVRLTTGRLRDQWHSMTRTGLVPRLLSHSPQPEIAMHRDDLQAAGIAEGELARICSRRGSIVMKVAASDDMRRGEAFVAMHWGSRNTSGPGVNALTISAFDPHSKQPELKHATIRVEPFVAVWRCMMLRTLHGHEDIACLQREIAPLMQRYDYAAVSFAQAKALVMEVELAAAEVPAVAHLEALDRLFGLDDEAEILLFKDTARALERRALLGENMLQALRACGSLIGVEGLKRAMLARIPVGGLGLQLLAPLSDLAGMPPPRGRAICSCFDVGEAEIRSALADGLGLAALQSALKCGTQCGSCVPELKRLVLTPGPDHTNWLRERAVVALD